MQKPIRYSTAAENLIHTFNLEHYVRRLFMSCAVKNSYHNVRHMVHVMLECYEAAIYEHIPHDQIRELLIAGLLHDLDHPGILRLDSENISDTIKAVRECAADGDKQTVDRVCDLILYTEYPYQANLPLSKLGDILRDADLTQSFVGQIAWIHEVLIGLTLEWELPLTPEHVDNQIKFIKGLNWKTEWARKKYDPTVVSAKIAEYENWKNILFS